MLPSILGGYAFPSIIAPSSSRGKTPGKDQSSLDDLGGVDRESTCLLRRSIYGRRSGRRAFTATAALVLGTIYVLSLFGPLFWQVPLVAVLVALAVRAWRGRALMRPRRLAAAGLGFAAGLLAGMLAFLALVGWDLGFVLRGDALEEGGIVVLAMLLVLSGVVGAAIGLVLTAPRVETHGQVDAEDAGHE
jgi:hypothetical protein